MGTNTYVSEYMFDLTQLFFVLAKEEGFASAKFEFTFAKGERERTK